MHALPRDTPVLVDPDSTPLSTPLGKWMLRMPSAAVTLGGPIKHFVDPNDGLAQRFRFRLNFLDPAHPYICTLVVPAVARLLAKSFSHRDALFEGPQRAAERAPQVFVERKVHHFRAISMTDMATIMQEIIVIDLPHDAVT